MPILPFLLIACASNSKDATSDSGDWVDPIQWSIQSPGPFQVGYQHWDPVYTDPLSGGDRQIPLGLWYPTTDNAGEPAFYLEGLYKDESTFLNATVAEAVHTDGYPVHVYSHGDRGWGATSVNMMRFFASHGWVAIAPDHTGNTLLQSDDPRPTAHYLHRPLDIQAALNALESLPQSNPLSRTDTDRVLLSGHSFGAYTVWAASGANFDPDSLADHCPNLAEGSCSESEVDLFLSGALKDPRVVAGIPMAGGISRGFFGDSGHLGVTIPTLLMSGTEDNDGTAGTWDSLQGMSQLAWLELEGGCHQSFATGICSTLDAATGFSIVNAYALALGRQAVLGDVSQQVLDLLAGRDSISDRAHYSLAESTR
jgi:predicted dienelactone hydrolase